MTFEDEKDNSKVKLELVKEYFVDEDFAVDGCPHFVVGKEILYQGTKGTTLQNKNNFKPGAALSISPSEDADKFDMKIETIDDDYPLDSLG